MSIDAYPLHCPTGWSRTPSHRRRASKYRVNFGQARDQMLQELKLLGATEVIVSTGVPLRRDGLPRAGLAEPADPGVAVYWTAERGPRVMACDSWRTVKENLRAVGLSIQALRTIERAGATQILERAYQGFAALPAPSVEECAYPWWHEALGVPPEIARESPHRITPELIEKLYRARARAAHPDSGGSHAAMVRLNAARAEALGGRVWVR